MKKSPMQELLEKMADLAEEEGKIAARKKLPYAATSAKAKDTLAALISSKNINGVKRWIKAGVPLNSPAKGHPPYMQRAISSKWAEGMSLLLRCGAPIDAKREEINKGAQGLGSNNLLGVCFEMEFIEGARILWDKFSKSEQVEAAATCQCKEGFLFLQSKGCTEGVSVKALDEVAIELMEEVVLSGNKECIEALKKLFTLQGKEPNAGQQHFNAWAQLVEFDNPKLVSVLAKAGALPSKEEQIVASIHYVYNKSHIAYENHLTTLREWKESRETKPKKNKDGALVVPEVERRWSLAEIMSFYFKVGRSCFLGAIKDTQFVRDCQSSPLVMHNMANYWPFDTHSAQLKAAGFELSNLKTSQGLNPLHVAIMNDLDKKQIERIARANRGWIHQRSEDGHLPIEMTAGETRAQLEVIFDQMEIKSAISKTRSGRPSAKAARI